MHLQGTFHYFGAINTLPVIIIIFFLDDSFHEGTSENCCAAHSPLWKVHTTCKTQNKMGLLYKKCITVYRVEIDVFAVRLS